MIEEIPREVLEAQARDEEHKGAIFELGLGSYIGVPLKRLGEPFGVITLVMAESKRRYGEKTWLWRRPSRIALPWPSRTRGFIATRWARARSPKLRAGPKMSSSRCSVTSSEIPSRRSVQRSN